MAGSTVETRIAGLFGRRLDGWTIEASVDSQADWVIALTHPASAGLIIPTGTAVEADAVETARRVLAGITEVDVATAAPTLEHADLIMGVRTLAKTFRWNSLEVRALAFLMFEHGHLTLDEMTWLSGYEGAGAPMQPTSPLG